jgi:hypothetical protein
LIRRSPDKPSVAPVSIVAGITPPVFRGPQKATADLRNNDVQKTHWSVLSRDCGGGYNDHTDQQVQSARVLVEAKRLRVILSEQQRIERFRE